MRRVGIISFAQDVRARDDRTPVEMVYPVIKAAVRASGLARADIAYTCAGSSDFLEGRPFSFGFVLDVAGAVPPIEESHVEGDGAWAAYDAWVRIQAGDADSALVIAWGKSSEGSLPHILNTTLDPFWEAPLGADAVALAALQAQAWMARNGATEADLAAVAAPREPGGTVVGPLRRGFLPPVTDGACALVMASEEVVARAGRPAAWVAGVAHATDAGCMGSRDLADAPSARAAMERAATMAGWRAPDVAELHAPFPHQELMLVEELALHGVARNPSGGALASNPIMAAGLIRLGEAALQVMGAAGERQVAGVRRALAHATAGHCLQANMVWLLEGEARERKRVRTRAAAERTQRVRAGRERVRVGARA